GGEWATRSRPARCNNNQKINPSMKGPPPPRQLAAAPRNGIEAHAMKSRATCPACTTKVMLSSGPNPRCPACGAGLKRKGTRLEFDENAPPPPKKKKKKRKKSGPNYPLIGGIAGGVVVLGALIWIAVAAFQSTQRPVKDDY